MLGHMHLHRWSSYECAYFFFFNFFFRMQQKENYFVIRFTRTLSLRFFFFLLNLQIRRKLTFVGVGIITIPSKITYVPKNNSLLETIFIRK